MTETPILVSRHGPIHRISLNRPAKFNAFTEDLHRALAQALDEARNDAACRVILLTGEGKAFCAGQDLDARFPTPDAPPPDTAAGLETFYNPLIRQIQSLPLPVVCAVNGIAAGAGAALALACDIVIASASAQFVLSFIKVGLGPDSGASWSLPRLVGLPRARAMALLGETIDAETAERWGMIWKCVAPDALAFEARTLCDRLAALPTEALAQTKQLYDEGAVNNLVSQLRRERDVQGVLARHPDYREGVLAFKAKRQPRFGPREV